MLFIGIFIVTSFLCRRQSRL